MANLCTNNVTINGSKEDIQKFDEILTKCKGLQTVGIWTGDTIKELGGLVSEVYCRSTIYDYFVSEDGLSIRMGIESAWDTPTEVFKFWRDKLPSIEIWYQSEEPGCEIYTTNDLDGEYYPEEYKLRYTKPNEVDEEEEYFESLDDLKEFITELTGEDIWGTDEIPVINEGWENQDNNAYIYCYEFEREDDELNYFTD